MGKRTCRLTQFFVIYTHTALILKEAEPLHDHSSGTLPVLKVVAPPPPNESSTWSHLTVCTLMNNFTFTKAFSECVYVPRRIDNGREILFYLTARRGF